MTRLIGAAVVLVMMAVACQPGSATSRPTVEDTPTSTATSVAPTMSPTPSGPTRSFLMGFTPFPFAGTPQSFFDALQLVNDNGDLMTHHLDGGVPWPQAASGDPYPTDFANELKARDQYTAPNMVRYVALTPISGKRNGLALLQANAGGQPLPPPWDSYSFDSPAVVDAYVAHVERMIDLLHPDYLAYAIEANMLLDNAPGQWDAFVSLASQVYPKLKAAHPDLPAFITIQAEWFHANEQQQTAAIEQLLPYTDMIAVSSYGYARGVDPTSDDNYFKSIAGLAPEKPFAIAETGWPAEDLSDPLLPSDWPSSAAAQANYLDWLLNQAERLDAIFVNWYLPRDFDQYWHSGLNAHPDAATIRLFRDIGLWDGDGNPRPAADLWSEWLMRPKG